jgi:hypothetical protein
MGIVVTLKGFGYRVSVSRERSFAGQGSGTASDENALQAVE